MKTRKVNDQQSLFDIALQDSGSVESIMDLALANGLSITDQLTTGKLLDCESPVYNRVVFDEYRLKGIVPATAMTEKDLPMEGIDYWYIFEYIVQ